MLVWVHLICFSDWKAMLEMTTSGPPHHRHQNGICQPLTRANTEMSIKTSASQKSQKSQWMTTCPTLTPHSCAKPKLYIRIVSWHMSVMLVMTTRCFCMLNAIQRWGKAHVTMWICSLTIMAYHKRANVTVEQVNIFLKRFNYKLWILYTCMSWMTFHICWV